MNARAPIRADLRAPSTMAARARALSTFVSSFKGAGMLGMLEWWHSRFRDSSGTRAIPTQARRAAGGGPGVQLGPAPPLHSPDAPQHAGPAFRRVVTRVICFKTQLARLWLASRSTH